MIDTGVKEREGVDRKLPDGWKWVKLGDVCELIMGQSPPSETYRNSPEGLPFFQGKADFGQKFPTPRVWCVQPIKIAEIGDILISVRAPVGSFNLVNTKCCIGRGLAAIRPKSNADIGFIISALTLYEDKLISLGSGSTFIAINRSDLENLEIPLPPLAEQKRIAAILNEQMEAVEKARKATEAQLEAAKELPAAYLRAVFNSPDAQKWEKKDLGDVSEIVSGVTLGPQRPTINTISVPYLRVANVKDGYLDLLDVYQIEATKEELAKYLLKYGDILLTEGGDPDKLGRGTFWEEQIQDCIHQNHIFRVRFNLNDFSPQFISAQIGSPYGKAYFLVHAKRTTGIATINRKVLSAFPLMIPSIDKQKQIAAELFSKMADVENLQKSLKSQLEAISQLPAAILRKAFNGEP